MVNVSGDLLRRGTSRHRMARRWAVMSVLILASAACGTSSRSTDATGSPLAADPTTPSPTEPSPTPSAGGYPPKGDPCDVSRRERLRFGTRVPDVWHLTDVPIVEKPSKSARPGARTYLNEHPEVGGDLFLTDGWLFVGFTQRAEYHLSKMREVYSDPEHLRAFRAQWTERELEALQDRLSDDRADLRREGIGVNDLGRSSYINRVEVSLDRLDQAWMTTLEARYGVDRLCFVAGKSEPG